MRLSDIIAHPSLAIYPEIGLVLFLLIFAGVVFYVARALTQEQIAHARALPLEPERSPDTARAYRSQGGENV